MSMLKGRHMPTYLGTNIRGVVICEAESSEVHFLFQFGALIKTVLVMVISMEK